LEHSSLLKFRCGGVGRRTVAADEPVRITDDFDADFGVDEWHGTNAFIREGEKVFRTYLVNSRGDDAMGSTWAYLDITALGRQEEWEDSPEGYPQTPPYGCGNYHDGYGTEA
jgi:predicted dithiol-disulfide oxidoreductase (DUF899 family)